MVLDESSSFKNSRSQRFRALKLVLPRITRLVELTGTPAPNGLEDLWAQIYLLDSGARLGKTLTSFREAFFTQDYSYPGQPYRTYSPQAEADERVKSLIADICVSMKAEDYLTLPEYIEDVVPVQLDAKARKAYDTMVQLCSGAMYDENKNVVPIHDCKIEAFMEVVEQLHGEHALVFYWFQHEQERLLAALQSSGLRVAVYKGDAEAEAWNRGDIDLLLAHPASCGYGLNLQRGGHHMIWFGFPNWALEIYQQANKRLHRQGQKFPVIAHHLVVQGGMDEVVLEALHDKGDAQDAIMQALQAKIEKYRGGKSHAKK